MELRTRYYNNVVIFSLNGRFDADTITDFTHAIQQQVESGYGRLVIDLKKVDFLSSVGIKTLVQTMQLTRQQGGDLRLANARGRVKYVLTLAGLNTVIKMYPNVVSATASYFPGPIPHS